MQRYTPPSSNAPPPITGVAPQGGPLLDHYITPAQLRDLVERAKFEDIGPAGLDVTSLAFVPADRTGQADVRARAGGRLAGAAILPAMLGVYDPTLTLTSCITDGRPIQPGETIATVVGSLRSILAMERVALNFMTHLSGVATLTAAFVDAVEGSGAKIFDTRKTLPGLRALEKYAVACGGGHSHRCGLHDAVLIKDNHLAGVPQDRLAETICHAVTQARSATPPPAFIEVEVDRLDQLRCLLEQVPQIIDLVLLDNMPVSQLQEAVAMRNKIAPRVELEASGGVDLQSVFEVAQAGIDRIAVGAITHSAPSLDIGLDLR